jgi:Uroporphyrinogen decarboxylase (URO-D)
MSSGNLGRLIRNPEAPVLLRGEIWVSPEVLTGAGFEQGPRGLVEFASSCGAGMCFFHWPDSAMASDVKELLDLAHAADLDCGLTLNGPFQNLTLTRNVLELLQEWHRDPSRFEALLAAEMEDVSETLDLLKGVEIELILITEDIAYTGGLYFSPELFRRVLVPFYSSLVGRFSSSRCALGWHSDGDVSPLLPDLVDCGFRFFSLEPESVDLLRFKQTYRSRVSLVGGIRAAWLAGKSFTPDEQSRCRFEISAMLREGGLVLASSCGLYNPAFLSNLKQLYRLADGLIPPSA